MYFSFVCDRAEIFFYFEQVFLLAMNFHEFFLNFLVQVNSKLFFTVCFSSCVFRFFCV